MYEPASGRPASSSRKRSCTYVRSSLVSGFVSVRAAASLEEARAYLARTLPSLLLADLQLPDGSSEELFTALAEEGAAVPIVVISAASNGREIAAKHGTEYLAKPFSIDDVISVTARLTAKGAKSAR